MKVLWRCHFYYIVNVYSSYCLSKKRLMWKEITKLKRKYEDREWCVGGDFNSIVCTKERKRSLLVNRTSEMIEFLEFIK